MVLNDTTSRTGLIQACEGYTGLGVAGISGTTTLLKDFTRRINSANRKVISTIFEVTGKWLFDDSNQTDLPQGTADLTSGTATYALPATALTVERIEIKDNTGLFLKLTPMSLGEIPDGVNEFMTDDGIPQYYRLTGNTIELFPAPNYNSTAGLKVYFLRDGVDFTYSDTIATPGFASLYHNVLAIDASLDWLKTNNPNSNTIAWLDKDEQKYMQDIQNFYSKRWKDNTVKLTTTYRSSR